MELIVQKKDIERLSSTVEKLELKIETLINEWKAYRESESSKEVRISTLEHIVIQEIKPNVEKNYQRIKRLEENLEEHKDFQNDYPTIRKIVFSAVGITITAVFVALVSLVVIR